MQCMAMRIGLTVLFAFVFTQPPGLGLAQERARLRVSTLFIGSSLLPFWVAKDQGYFARAGVDVELISMQSNLSTSALLAAEFFLGLIEGTKRLKSDKELALKLIRKNLRLDNAEIIETAYDDGLTVSYPYFTERQFQVTVDLLSKSLGQPVELSYSRVVDHGIVDEIARNGGL